MAWTLASVCASDCPGALQFDIIGPHPTSEKQPHLLSANEQPRPSTSAEPSEPLPQPHFQFASEQKLTELAKGLVPENTSKSTKWAVNNFEAWLTARNASHPEDLVPEDILMSTDANVLNTHLSRFVVETHKSNGEPYPPATLHQLLCGVLRHMRDCNPGCPNFLDKKDSFKAPWMLIFITYILRALGDKWSMQRLFQPKKRISCGRLACWISTHQKDCRMLYSTQLAKCFAFEVAKNTEH